MKTYRLPGTEPPPIVDQWLADIAATVAPILPFLVVAGFAVIFLARGIRNRRDGKDAPPETEQPSAVGADSADRAPQGPAAPVRSHMNTRTASAAPIRDGPRAANTNSEPSGPAAIR